MSESSDPTRKENVLERGFSPESLVRSWFLRLDENEFVWQGLIIAEPQAGVYLVETYDWFTGDPIEQRLVEVEKMIGRTADDVDNERSDDVEWRFYDSHEKMRAAYFREQAKRRVEEDVPQQ